MRPLDEDASNASDELDGNDPLEIADKDELDAGIIAELLFGTGVELLTGAIAVLESKATELEIATTELEGAAAELLLGAVTELLAGTTELERGRTADELAATALELAVFAALELLALTAVESFESVLLELLSTLSLVVSAGADIPDELDFLRDEDDFELEDCIPSWEGLLMSSELSESGSIELSLEISSISE